MLSPVRDLPPHARRSHYRNGPDTPRTSGRHRRPVSPGRSVLLSLLAVLSLLLGSGTAISLTAASRAPAAPSAPGPPMAALGAAPPEAAPPPSATPSPSPSPSPAPEPEPAPPPPPPPPPQPVDELTALENEVTALANAERVAAGCGEVRTDERLRTAARDHSLDMAVNDYFSHTGLDGRSPSQRMRDAGYPAPAGENIAVGYRTPADVMDGWMNSDGHRRNLLTCSHQAIGVGLAYNSHGRPYWTQVFGR